MEHRTQKLINRTQNKDGSVFRIPCSPRASCGFGMIEMIVGAAILSVSLLAISSFFQSALKASGVTQLSIRADYLLEEGIESVKLLRDAGYANNISTLGSSAQHLVWNGTTWATTTANVFIDGLFERSFTVASVKRDANDDISATGSNDPNTKLITMSVAWKAQGATTTRSIATYITNMFNN